MKKPRPEDEPRPEEAPRLAPHRGAKKGAVSKDDDTPTITEKEQ
jgi:hypothetical protein